MPVTIDDLAQAAIKGEWKEMSVEEWGGSDGVNCYAWAANCRQPQNGKPTPGQRNGYNARDADKKFDAQRCIAGAERDGMIKRTSSSQTDPPSPNDGHYLVALYLSTTGSDFHWYRKEPKTGRWTHKPGAHNNKNVDATGKVLPTELIMVSHVFGNTNYKFVTYFEVPMAGLAV